MGHIHLGVLPSSQKWRQVVELLDGGASDAAVIQGAAIAAERELQNATRDPVFIECIRLMMMIPAAAREKEFGRALRRVGLPVGDSPDLLGIASAAGVVLDQLARAQSGHGDFGEISRRAFLTTLTNSLGERLPGLFEATVGDTHAAARYFSQSPHFASISRTFFTQLLSKSLGYWLDRTLSTQVGTSQRFGHIGDRATFDRAINQYAYEATRIIREFSSGWYGKTLYRDGSITSGTASVFGAVALKKIIEELKRKRDAHA